MKHVKKSFLSFTGVDWTKPAASAGLFIVYAASRIPLLRYGFGSDPDAWRIANAAYDLRYSGIYHVSRFPGFPVPEITNALVINYGWIATNSLTALISFVSVMLFAGILKQRNEPHKGLLTFTYAFLPILWVNSAATMDYMWALTGILASWYWITAKRPISAGIALGFAAGCRVSSAILAVTFIVLIWSEFRKSKPIIVYSLTAACSAVIVFLPLFFTYGLSFITTYPNSISLSLIFTGISRQFGAPAAILGVLLILISIKQYARNLIRCDADTIFLTTGIVVIGILFAAAPYETAYLIPAVPFVLLLINKLAKPLAVAVFCIAAIANAGLIGKTAAIQKKEIAAVQRILDADVRGRAVVIVGWWMPYVANLNQNILQKGETPFTFPPRVLEDLSRHSGTEDTTITVRGVCDDKNGVYYISTVPLTTLTALLERGYMVYFAKDMDVDTKRLYGYDISQYPCIPIW